MQIHLFLLDLFASIALISAAMTIAAKNPIHSVAFLTLVSCNATGPLVPLGIEFIALMFIIIYVGAIAAPFLSAATTSNTKANESRENWLRYSPIGGLISITPSSEISPIFDSDSTPSLVFGGGLSEAGSSGSEALKPAPQSLYNDFFYYQGQKPWTSLVAEATNIQSLGSSTHTHYPYYSSMASSIPSTAMIGAIVSTTHKRQNASKKQLIFKQVARNLENAIGYTAGPLGVASQARNGPTGRAC